MHTTAATAHTLRVSSLPASLSSLERKIAILESQEELAIAQKKYNEAVADVRRGAGKSLWRQQQRRLREDEALEYSIARDVVAKKSEAKRIAEESEAKRIVEETETAAIMLEARARLCSTEAAAEREARIQAAMLILSNQKP
jgi:hypothetical protein